MSGSYCALCNASAGPDEVLVHEVGCVTPALPGMTYRQHELWKRGRAITKADLVLWRERTGNTGHPTDSPCYYCDLPERPELGLAICSACLHSDSLSPEPPLSTESVDG